MKKFEMPEIQVTIFEEDIMTVTVSGNAAYDNGFSADTSSGSGIF